MQLVSRIARNIGVVLGLNLDLIEAIALGHDIGHTPFGHAGERILNKIYCEKTGRFFNHNVHSVRVLDYLYNRNISLQTLDGVLCHNGEFELKKYKPTTLNTFDEFDENVEACYLNGDETIKKLIPSTLEGCVVRVCDMIAYIGKDRQDAIRAKIIDEKCAFTDEYIGADNAPMINNLTVDIIENSYRKDYISLSEKGYKGLKTAKKENYEKIYKDEKINKQYDEQIQPMIEELYKKLLEGITNHDYSSIIYKYYLNDLPSYQKKDYLKQEPNQIVVDYIAGMTDDYFIDLYKCIFPKSKHDIKYVSYFQ